MRYIYTENIARLRIPVYYVRCTRKYINIRHVRVRLKYILGLDNISSVRVDEDGSISCTILLLFRHHHNKIIKNIIHEAFLPSNRVSSFVLGFFFFFLLLSSPLFYS